MVARQLNEMRLLRSTFDKVLKLKKWLKVVCGGKTHDAVWEIYTWMAFYIGHLSSPLSCLGEVLGHVLKLGSIAWIQQSQHVRNLHRMHKCRVTTVTSNHLSRPHRESPLAIRGGGLANDWRRLWEWHTPQFPHVPGVVSLTFREMSKIIARKYTMPEITFVVRTSN